MDDRPSGTLALVRDASLGDAKGIVERLATGRTGGHGKDLEVGPGLAVEQVGADIAHPFGEGRGLGFRGLGHEDVEPVRGRPGHAIGLTRGLAHDRPDARRVALDRPEARHPQADDEDGRMTRVARDPGVLVTQGRVPVRTGVERDLATHRTEQFAAWGTRPGGTPGPDGRAFEERLDVLASPLVDMVRGQHEARALS